MYKLRGQGGVFELTKESTGEVIKKGTFIECYEVFESNVRELEESKQD